MEIRAVHAVKITPLSQEEKIGMWLKGVSAAVDHSLEQSLREKEEIVPANGSVVRRVFVPTGVLFFWRHNNDKRKKNVPPKEIRQPVGNVLFSYAYGNGKESSWINHSSFWW